nr:hypothetical protein BaRGS_026860 [Batillaria attramentaria]
MDQECDGMAQCVNGADEAQCIPFVNVVEIQTPEPPRVITFDGRGSFHIWRPDSSCEVSAFIICLITLDRFLVLRFPFSQLHFQKRNDFPGQDYSFVVMIVVNFVLFVLIAAGQVFIYWSIRSNSMRGADTTRKSKDLTIARRLITIAVTDFLCWFPIGLLGLLASNSVPVPGEVNVAMVIFILPLNSALNPFLYTLNVMLERRRLAGEARMKKIVESKIQTMRVSVTSQNTVHTAYGALDVIKMLLKNGSVSKGMGFRPMPDERNRLIYFVEREKDSFKAHVQSIKERLKPYIEAEASGIGRNCSQGFDPAADEACAVSVAQLTQNCNEENDFGYGLPPAKPCVLLGLNKIFGWMPEEYTPNNIDVSGADQEQILAKPDMIYVRCRGENAADVDNLGSDITYYPDQGFPHYYYPYTNQKDYLAPLVFVQFGSVQLGVALMVECRALTPNIRHDNTDKDIGGVRFQLLID